jgi:hypothetical protein
VNAAAAKPRKPAKPQKPLYFQTRRALLIDHKTGEVLQEQVSVLAPLTQWDTRAMRDRGYKVGQTVRGRIERPRNPKFNGLAHALGALIADHCEGFEGMDGHDALKKVQAESGVCCEQSTVELDLTSLGIGKIQAPVTQPQSIAFDSMPEEDFAKLVHGICQYLREKYHGVPPNELVEIIAAVEEGHS